MAIAIPFLIASTATGAAVAAAIGVTAATLATVTTIAFAVTGINEKINKAASNVFGEDLVKVVNIAGMAYGMYNGGFDVSSSFGDTAAVTASAADVASGLDPSVAPLPADPSAAAAPVDVVSSSAPIPSQVTGVEPISPSYNLMDASRSTLSGTTPQVTQAVTDTATDLAGRGLTANGVSASGSAAPAAASAQAAGANATLSQYSPGYNAASAGATQAAPGITQSFMQKLMAGVEKNPLVASNVIAGLGTAYSGASARAQQQARYDEQLATQKRLRGIGSFRLKG